jgi:hypothetical protein
VLIVETRVSKMMGFTLRWAPKIRLEHADPAPNGEVFDGVDDACHRARIRT